MENERSGPRGRREGSGFDSRRRGDRNPRRREHEPSGGFYRVLAELPKLEKVLSKADFSGQRAVLRDIVQALKPLRVRSLEELDLNTRGKLMTSLLRVQRQPKPAASAPAEPPPPATEAPPSEGGDQASAGAQPGDSPGPGSSAPVGEDKAQIYGEVLSWVGAAWRSVGEAERANAAFAASGLPPPPEEPASEPTRAGSSRPERTNRPKDKRRPEKGARPTRQPWVESADWAAQAREFEEKGRTRDAGRLHQKHQSFGEAARLFELGGDMKGALACFVSAKDKPNAERLLQAMKPEEWGPVLEKAGAYEWLMELYVARSDFPNVARLYERARQNDQAALAWERAGKFSQARHAFERAKDSKNAERMKALEAQQKVEQGDRLGAALLLVSLGEKDKAVETLSALPPPKAFRFLKRANLEEAAQALAERELEKAKGEGKSFAQARWLEDLGQIKEAAEAWESAGRKDRAVPLYEQLGDFARAASAAESAGLREKAAELYARVGDSASAERVLAQPANESASPPQEDPEAPEQPAAPQNG